jgi:hypothetical protein
LAPVVDEIEPPIKLPIPAEVTARLVPVLAIFPLIIEPTPEEVEVERPDVIPRTIDPAPVAATVEPVVKLPITEAPSPVIERLAKVTEPRNIAPTLVIETVDMLPTKEPK